MISKPETVVKTAIIPRQSIGIQGNYSTVEFDELVARKRNAQEQFTNEIKDLGYLVDAVRCELSFIKDYVGLVKTPFTSAQLQFTFSVRKVKQLKPFDLDKALAGATVVQGDIRQRPVARIVVIPDAECTPVVAVIDGRLTIFTTKGHIAVNRAYPKYDLFLLD